MKRILIISIFAVFLLMTVLCTAAKDKDTEEYRYIHEYDPTPKRLPPNLLKQLLDIVKMKYDHLKNGKSKNDKMKIS